jgi:hypothetical protein
MAADGTGRPDHINDVIIRDYPQTEERPFNPFGWTPNKPHIYANLQTLAEGFTKPTEDYLNAQLAQMQADFDAVVYKRNRRDEYPSIGDQLDMQYHDGVDGTTTWADAIAAVKTKYPKPS